MSDDPVEILRELDPAVRAAVLDRLPGTHLAWLQEHGVRADDTSARTPTPDYPWQTPPDGDWWGWAIVGGRGTGKTLGAASWIDREAQHFPGIRVGIIAPTQPDARATCVEGETGLLAVNPTVRFNRGNLEGRWSNGSQFRCFGAYTPEDRQRLRGPQWHRAWLEEFAAWRQLDEEPRDDHPDAWTHITFGLRLGRDPRFVLGTTPKRRRRFREVMEHPEIVVTRGTTYEAHGLADPILRRYIEMYAGTRLERQELLGEELDDVEGALWTSESIGAHRVAAHPPLRRIVVGVDPPGSKRGTCGIVAVGVSEQTWPHPKSGRPTPHGYVLADASLSGAPHEWAQAAVDLYHDLEAETIVAEVNYGGDMVESTIATADGTVPVEIVRATRGKKVRAEPASTLATHGLLHHVGHLPLLEEEQTTWVEDDSPWSPNRLDALVWAVQYVLSDLGWQGDTEVHVPRGSRAQAAEGVRRTAQTRRRIQRSR